MIAVSLPVAHTPSLSVRWPYALFAWLLSLVWILVLYRDTAASMIAIWSRSDTFAHGFLIAPIVLWLIWRQRHAIWMQVPRPMPAVFPLLGMVGVLWVLGDLAALNSMTQLAFVALLVLSVPLILGPEVARVIRFPLGFLFFAVPIGEFLLPTFMQWTADFTVSALRFSGVPVYREGLNFVIPTGRWSVVEACSGVRYLIASCTVGTLFAYLNYQSTRRRVLFVLVSLGVPVIANWVRAYMVVMLGHLSGNKLATGVDHLIYGWLFFGVVIALMFFVGARWAEPASAPSASRAPNPQHTPRSGIHSIGVAAVCYAALVAWPVWAVWSLDRGGHAQSVRVMGQPTLVYGWSAAPMEGTLFKPAYQNPTAQNNSLYALQDRWVGLYLGLYQRQGRDHKLVGSGNELVTRSDPHWALDSGGTRKLVLGGSQQALRTSELRGLDLMGSGQSGPLLVWQLYWVNGFLTDSDYIATAYGVLNRLLARRDDAAVIVLYTPKGSAGEGDAALESFLSAHYASINQLLTAQHTP